MILPCLYVALVLPKESLKDKKYESEFSRIDQWLDTVVSKEKKSSSYKYDEGRIQFTRHIRNAVSHNRVEMIMGSGNNVVGIRFRDEYKGQEFMAEIDLRVLGCLVQELQKIILMRVKEIQRLQSDA